MEFWTAWVSVTLPKPGCALVGEVEDPLAEERAVAGVVELALRVEGAGVEGRRRRHDLEGRAGYEAAGRGAVEERRGGPARRGDRLDRVEVGLDEVGVEGRRRGEREDAAGRGLERDRRPHSPASPSAAALRVEVERRDDVVPLARDAASLSRVESRTCSGSRSSRSGSRSARARARSASARSSSSRRRARSGSAPGSGGVPDAPVLQPAPPVRRQLRPAVGGQDQPARPRGRGRSAAGSPAVPRGRERARASRWPWR